MANDATKKMLTLEDVLGLPDEQLTAVVRGTYHVKKLGDVPYTALDFAEFKQIRKDCITTEIENGQVNTQVDDVKMAVKCVITAVAKDTRSNFTFASKQLFKKLEDAIKAKDPNSAKSIIRAEDAVAELLFPGEIMNFAQTIQVASGLSAAAAKKDSDDIKNA